MIRAVVAVFLFPAYLQHYLFIYLFIYLFFRYKTYKNVHETREIAKIGLLRILNADYGCGFFSGGEGAGDFDVGTVQVNYKIELNA